MAGRVTSFDEATGWGEIAADHEAGSVAGYPFHCTAVVDGTRTIAVDTPVTFSLAPGHRGVWEATGVVVLAGS